MLFRNKIIESTGKNIFEDGVCFALLELINSDTYMTLEMEPSLTLLPTKWGWAKNR